LEETFIALEASPCMDALSVRLEPSDFGTSKNASGAANSYVRALTNLSDMLNNLHEAGIAHARALRSFATTFENVDNENAARVTGSAAPLSQDLQ
jgi:hypothetical protein